MFRFRVFFSTPNVFLLGVMIELVGSGTEPLVFVEYVACLL